ncbi:threonine-phosphate decarboxylase CobD [Robertmurraya beringensis]|uniref:threonine-phosphate decarboxylase n=1 Tax=Robertmurraya beringensis TaxID=641660 RepID=A0ABV6L2C3_9BACI
MKWPTHGANPQFLYKALHLDMPETVIDFSANINPIGPPATVKNRWNELFSLVSDYPDPTAERLTGLLSKQEGVRKEQILVGNGGAELISLVGRLLTGKKVLIVQPAFSEYEEACRVNQCEVRYHLMDVDRWELRIDELLVSLREVDAVFLCNPNNPTGMFFPKHTIEVLARECARYGTLLIVDEAFYDFIEEYESIVSCLQHCENMIILRSMTKMFSIPGIRLGYLMANEALLAKIRESKPHWSVNAIAMKVGEWCLSESDYIEQTIQLIKKERERLQSFYRDQEFSYSPSNVNFYLLKDTKVSDPFPFFRFLMEKGMIPRHTMNFPGLDGKWLRLAIKGENEHERLLEVMSAWRRLDS